MTAAATALIEFAVNPLRAPAVRRQPHEAALVALLERELEFLQGGGYTRDAAAPWRPTWLLLDSPVCARRQGAAAACAQCPLRASLPAPVAARALAAAEPVCYRLVITARGETLGELQRAGPNAKLTAAFAAWLLAELGRRRVRATPWAA
ncbi:MAG TPA: hypothetical protein VNF74_15100 [Terriglobales bacterium]|nr:hypothetical protein [Terriglobales bacterium]